MKIKITHVDIIHSDDSLTLEQCGFKVGDIVETTGTFNDGSVCAEAPRDTADIKKGDSVSINDDEFEVVE